MNEPRYKLVQHLGGTWLGQYKRFDVYACTDINIIRVYFKDHQYHLCHSKDFNIPMINVVGELGQVPNPTTEEIREVVGIAKARLLLKGIKYDETKS